MLSDKKEELGLKAARLAGELTGKAVGKVIDFKVKQIRKEKEEKKDK